MEYTKIWETKLAETFKTNSSIEKVLELIASGRTVMIKDNYTEGSSIQTIQERFFSERGINVLYCDSEHPTLITDDPFDPIIIGISFFEQHKEEIKKAMQKQQLEEGDFFHVNPYNYDEEFMKKILASKEGTYVSLRDVELTEEQIKIMQDKFFDSTLTISDTGETREISNKYPIQTITLDSLRKKSVSLNYNFTQRDLENVKYIDEKSEISIQQDGWYIGEEKRNLSDSKEYFEGIIKFINRMQELGRTNIVKIDVDRRSDFAPYLDRITYDNLIINNDLHDYALQAYITEEKKLEALVADIKSSDMSPYEKYLAVYDIVKNYKPYKENEEDRSQARSLRNILDNEYMVCVGYAKLLEVLLDKVGINTEDMSVSLDISYDEGFDVSDTPVDMAGHARVLVSLKDPKYGIDGYYVADPTWDNDEKRDLYNYANLEMKSTEESKRMFSLSELDLLFNAQDFGDYSNKINHYFNRKLMEAHNSKYKQPEVKIVNSIYKDIVNKIASHIKIIDPESFQKIKESYKKTLNIDSEEAYCALITTFGNFIISKVNNKISSETLATAATEAKIATKKTTLPREESIQKIIEEKEERDLKAFPFRVVDQNSEEVIHI